MVRPTLGLASLAALTTAGSPARAASSSTYSIVDVFNSTNFFNQFDFFTQPDPTHGFVKYVDVATANRNGLAGFTQGGVYLGVDYTNTTTTGRASVRVTSKKSYTKGLFIADIAHMPAGAAGSSSCGLWPAFWMFGPNWPASGEIDILEGVNSQAANAVTLHTAAGCSIANTAGAAPGTKLVSSDCHGSEGCSQTTLARDNNYGAAFNAAGGGVYALEWTDAAITAWFFPRGSALATRLTNTNSSSAAAAAAAPDPSTFGTPLAHFLGGTSCPISTHFANHNLVFDTTFCGDWAGRAWASDKACAALAPRCEDYVGKNPGAFSDAYWVVRDVRVYQVGAGGGQKQKRTWQG